jgi:O-antigen ligase
MLSNTTVKMFGRGTATAYADAPVARVAGPDSLDSLRRAAFSGVCVLAIVAPFELTRPLVRLPAQSITNLEIAVLAVFGVWFAAIVRAGRLPAWRTPLTKPWLALLAAMAVASVAAPVARANALHMTARFGVAFAIFLLTVNGVVDAARLNRAAALVLVAGALVALLAILEFVQVGAVLEWLQLFRPQVAVVGSQIRAGGPLQYPTIASMFLEVAFAAGLGLLMVAIDFSRPAAATAVFVALVVVAEAITLTFTRAGLVTMATSLVFVGGRRWRLRSWDRGVTLLAVLALVIAAAFGGSRSSQSVWLRLTSEAQEAWYRFAVKAPTQIALTTGRNATIDVAVANTGRLTWDSQADPPFYLSYHWLEADADRVVAFEGVRTEFPVPVDPGVTVSVPALLRSPREPGRYRLQWDIVQEGRLWFSTEPGATTNVSIATVTGQSVSADAPIATRPLPRRAVRPGRLQLWRAGARMLASHPILGVGPDNFRLTYGDYAGIAHADPRIHTNNMYLELVVGSGLLGAVALAWLLWRLGGCMIAAVRVAVESSARGAALGVVAAAGAVLIHGIFDSFVGFTPTYILIALTLGLVVACTNEAEVQPHAHRV